MFSLRDIINDPGRAAVGAGPSHKDIWDREDQRFKMESDFISQQNVESRNHALQLGAQNHEHSMAYMGHMDSQGSSGGFHANGMLNTYTSSGAGQRAADAQVAVQAAKSQPKVVAESRNASANAGVADVQGATTAPALNTDTGKRPGGRKSNQRSAAFGSQWAGSGALKL